jgi:hypothetical protein
MTAAKNNRKIESRMVSVDVLLSLIYLRTDVRLDRVGGALMDD